MEKSTIYKVECVPNGKLYIGMTRNFHARRHTHLFELNAGRHRNSDMQEDFNSYGEDAFVFTQILSVDKKGARAHELHEMRKLTHAGFSLYNPEAKPKAPAVLHHVTGEYERSNDELYTIRQVASFFQVGVANVEQLFILATNPLRFQVINERGARRVTKSQLLSFLDAAPRFGGAS